MHFSSGSQQHGMHEGFEYGCVITLGLFVQLVLLAIGSRPPM
jgi:hypothetical protein